MGDCSTTVCDTDDNKRKPVLSLQHRGFIEKQTGKGLVDRAQTKRIIRIGAFIIKGRGEEKGLE